MLGRIRLSSCWSWARLVLAQAPASRNPKASGPQAKAQPRPHGQRVKVDPAAITVEDGDGVIIRWSDQDTEIVRILGIDTPEVRRLEHNLPYDQPFGPEARAFAQGAFAAATDVELLRSPTLDPYGRTLAYAVHQRPELLGPGHQGRLHAARRSATTATTACPARPPRSWPPRRPRAPLPFEPPHQYRARMRTLTESLKSRASIPRTEGPGDSYPRPLDSVLEVPAITGPGGDAMPIVGLKGERVRLVPPDRTLPPRECPDLAQRPRGHGDAQAQPRRHPSPGGALLRADRDPAR